MEFPGLGSGIFELERKEKVPARWGGRYSAQISEYYANLVTSLPQMVIFLQHFAFPQAKSEKWTSSQWP